MDRYLPELHDMDRLQPRAVDSSATYFNRMTVRSFGLKRSTTARTASPISCRVLQVSGSGVGETSARANSSGTAKHPTGSPAVITAGVERHLVQPGVNLGLLPKRRECIEDFKEHVLCNVLGGHPISCQIPGEAVHPVLPGLIQASKRRPIAPSAPVYSLFDRVGLTTTTPRPSLNWIFVPKGSENFTRSSMIFLLSSGVANIGQPRCARGFL
jgi:hypothetical protein